MLWGCSFLDLRCVVVVVIIIRAGAADIFVLSVSIFGHKTSHGDESKRFRTRAKNMDSSQDPVSRAVTTSLITRRSLIP